MSDQKLSKIKDPRIIAAVLAVSLVLSMAANFGLITPQQSQEWQNTVSDYAGQIDNLEAQYNNLTDQYNALQNNYTELQNRIDIPTNSSISAMRKGYSYQVSFSTNSRVPDTTAALQSGIDGAVLCFSTNQTFVWQQATRNASVLKAGGSIYLAEGNWNQLTVTVPTNVSVTIDAGAYGYQTGQINGTLNDYHNLAFYQNGALSQIPFNSQVFIDGAKYRVQAANRTITYSSADAFTTIQNAINTAGNGSLVYVNQGFYPLNANHLTLNNIGVSLQGAGMGKTVLKSTGEVIRINNAAEFNYNQSVRDMTLDGTDSSGYGLYLVGVEVDTFSNLQIINCLNGIYLAGSTGNTFINNVVTRCGTGIYLSWFYSLPDACHINRFYGNDIEQNTINIRAEGKMGAVVFDSNIIEISGQYEILLQSKLDTQDYAPWSMTFVNNYIETHQSVLLQEQLGAGSNTYPSQIRFINNFITTTVSTSLNINGNGHIFEGNTFDAGLLAVTFTINVAGNNNKFENNQLSRFDAATITYTVTGANNIFHNNERLETSEIGAVTSTLSTVSFYVTFAHPFPSAPLITGLTAINAGYGGGYFSAYNITKDGFTVHCQTAGNWTWNWKAEWLQGVDPYSTSAPTSSYTD